MCIFSNIVLFLFFQKSVSGKSHYLHRRAIELLGQFHRDPIPNFNDQARSSNSKHNEQVDSPVEWLQKQTVLGSHDDGYSPRDGSGDGYASHVTHFGANYPQHGYYKEGKVETIETKEYRIYDPSAGLQHRQGVDR